MPESHPPRRCRYCREMFSWKRGKKFCKEQCRVDYHKAGNTPTKALEARMKKLISAGTFNDLIREEARRQLRALQSANAGMPQVPTSPEKSTNI